MYLRLENEKISGIRRDHGSGIPYTIWRSDGLQERLMMWEAVESIEIVEADEDVISLIQSTWQKYPWHSMAQCTIIHMKIEDYLQTTSSKYDTVYIDT